MRQEKIVDLANSENCPVRNVLDRFGDKWSTLILLVLGRKEPLRFGAIHRSIGTISQKMLTVSLKKLEADGLVDRTVFAEVPPRVEYCLTERGKSLLPVLQQLVDWANEHMEDIRASRAASGVD
ncbi:HxlR family transcriptional regulator [Neolewinella xylanilytica]|uniref:HxlR family transcriptional regulator n=1 Tax=Neolewinella xylanilytica TaxID=1514080 RepID=A0A2S6IAC6_9BACT|nr:helix-turn-helix domain-containing protein [Neolewinella xylanilytica]PPK88445.1 HxlR family transcriptional regulator [Neolewinella xylanilytica]